ncbi:MULTISPECIES: hypothetical protein [unclassified Streptomyces]|uniref:hypothetical protein n=1 Tax=unclassified Streptomyces TaxID=2593676 RepID=UPI0004C95EC2|nr:MULTISPECIES: hypothetical protein [unclassified Streptomyces]KOV86098.1 hypothetical protein ADL02_19615 [Streptomyces sp. NRRL WC-3723]
MGYYPSAWLAYGIQIPDTSSNELEDALGALDGQQRGDKADHVGYLHAGRYDAEDTYLVTQATEAEIGSSVVVAPHQTTGDQYADWDHNLAAAARALGITDPVEPSWLLIAHVA